MPTKSTPNDKPLSYEQALEEIEKLKAVNAEAQAKIVAQEKELEDLSSDQEGWLIRTPSPAYDGSTYEVSFEDGLGFVPRGAHYERFAIKEKETRKKFYTDEEWKAVKDREKRTTAECMVNALVTQFGYEAEFIDRSRLPELKKIRANRKRERIAFEQEMKANSPVAASKIVPAYFGR